MGNSFSGKSPGPKPHVSVPGGQIFRDNLSPFNKLPPKASARVSGGWCRGPAPAMKNAPEQCSVPPLSLVSLKPLI